MKKNIRKNIETGILCGLLCAVFLSFSRFNVACDGLRGGVLRLHIIANSDGEADQAVKLLVRDRLLSETGGIFEEKKSLKEAEAQAEESLDVLTEAADTVLRENNMDYTACVTVGDSYFDTREYDSFTLPAGVYRSLIVRLGEGEGHNWWCVVFPAVCIPAADAQLSDAVNGESVSIAQQPRKYVMRFKSVELYEELKRRLQHSSSTE